MQVQVAICLSSNAEPTWVFEHEGRCFSIAQTAEAFDLDVHDLFPLADFAELQAQFSCRSDADNNNIYEGMVQASTPSGAKWSVGSTLVLQGKKVHAGPRSKGWRMILFFAATRRDEPRRYNVEFQMNIANYVDCLMELDTTFSEKLVTYRNMVYNTLKTNWHFARQSNQDFAVLSAEGWAEWLQQETINRYAAGRRRFGPNDPRSKLICHLSTQPRTRAVRHKALLDLEQLRIEKLEVKKHVQQAATATSEGVAPPTDEELTAYILCWTRAAKPSGLPSSCSESTKALLAAMAEATLVLRPSDPRGMGHPAPLRLETETGTETAEGEDVVKRQRIE